VLIAGNRATTRDSIGQKICPGAKSRPQSADVTERLRENRVEMLGAFEASRKLAT